MWRWGKGSSSHYGDVVIIIQGGGRERNTQEKEGRLVGRNGEKGEEEGK